MRKHPLIALTAFTALGASAITGTTAGSFNSSVLASSHDARSSVSFAGDVAAQARGGILAANRALAAEVVNRPHGGRNLNAMHDPLLRNHSTLSDATGLPVVPMPAIVVVAAPAPPPPPPPPVVAPAPAPPPPPPAAPTGGAWYQLRVCESGDNYAEDTGNGYYGAYQFSQATWNGLGFSGLPSAASPAVQDQAAQELQARSGWGQWPQCAAELGLY